MVQRDQVLLRSSDLWLVSWDSHPVIGLQNQSSAMRNHHTAWPERLWVKLAVGKREAGMGNGRSYCIPLGAEGPGRHPRVHVSLEVSLCPWLCRPRLCGSSVSISFHPLIPRNKLGFTSTFPSFFYLSCFPPPLCTPFSPGSCELEFNAYLDELTCVVYCVKCLGVV